jgi:hypothetical protein
MLNTDIEEIKLALVRWGYEANDDIIERLCDMIEYDGNYDIEEYKPFVDEYFNGDPAASAI